MDSSIVSRPLVPSKAQPVGCAIVFAADPAYAAPLATALLSLAESNSNAWPLDVHVIHEGIDEIIKARICRSLPKGSANITWHAINTASFAGSLFTRPGVSKMTFARIVLPQVLPSTCRRALYLDGDILVLASLEKLWNLDLGGAVVGAVPDYCLDHAVRHGLGPKEGPAVTRYFNAGVILIDIDEWRRERVTEKALRYLEHFPEAEYSDQDALNFACDGKWKIMNQSWNFQFDPSQDLAAERRSRNIAIAHFVTFAKPWRSGSLSPNVAFYEAFRSRTLFRLTPRQRAQSCAKRVASRLLARSDLLRTVWRYARSKGEALSRRITARVRTKNV
jgi:lipopolysaccharide biosynthesis glycosyltransferase